LLWLGDIIPLPAGPLANVLSIGDVVIFVGLLFLLHRTCRPPTRKLKSRRPAPVAEPPASVRGL
jgi:hypothetical protein